MRSKTKRAEAELRRRNRELALLNRVIAASAADLEPEAILETVCRELALAFDAPWAAACLMNAERAEKVAISGYAAEGYPPLPGEVALDGDNLIPRYLLAHQSPLVAGDAQRDPRLAAAADWLSRRGIGALLAVPFLVKGEVVGCLGVFAAGPREFSEEEVNLAWSVADQVAGALARARLDQEWRRLAAAIEQTADSVVVTDTGGAIVYVNPAFERITGYSQAEAVGQHTRFLKSAAHRQGGTVQDAAYYEELWATIAAGQVWHGRLVNRRKDGALYTVDMTIAPVRDEHGAIVNYVAIQRDVTRELQLEAQYLQAQRMEAVGRLTAGVAHDFNNLLTAITGFAELALARTAADAPLQEFLEKIHDAGRRAAELTNQLLAFSRKQVIEPRALNLNTLLAGLAEMLRRVIGEDVELRLVLAHGLWSMRADPSQLEQVILNLAVNARDAMPGGGKLTIETANVTLDEAYAALHLEAQPGEHVLLAISDTGVGMSEEVKAHLFEPFFTTKELGRGTGLGLATVYGIVKQSGGHIWVYSEEGLGATFKIYLPREVAAVPQEVVPAGAGVAVMPGGHETILLAEDDERVAGMASHTLRERGYTVLEARSGEEALEMSALHPGPIHLLLTDVVMPGMNGKALAEQLTRVRPNLKVLFMSGYTDNAIAQHGVLEPGVALSLGTASLLPKPFGVKSLTRKVREVLDGGRQITGN